MNNILLIEDEPSILELLKKKIESAGMNVLTATDGEAGLQTALDQKPDLIILDLILPKLDGMSVLENLRQDEWGKNVPIIILSNLGTGDEMKKAEEYNVKDFIIKTEFRLEDLVQKIQENLQK